MDAYRRNTDMATSYYLKRYPTAISGTIFTFMGFLPVWICLGTGESLKDSILFYLTSLVSFPGVIMAGMSLSFLMIGLALLWCTGRVIRCRLDDHGIHYVPLAPLPDRPALFGDILRVLFGTTLRPRLTLIPYEDIADIQVRGDRRKGFNLYVQRKSNGLPERLHTLTTLSEPQLRDIQQRVRARL